MASRPASELCDFRLFKLTKPLPDVEYVATLKLPRGEVLFIDAWVVEHDNPDGSKGKHFEGMVVRGAPARQLLRHAVQTSGHPQDLIDLMNGEELNDPLPPQPAAPETPP